MKTHLFRTLLTSLSLLIVVSSVRGNDLLISSNFSLLEYDGTTGAFIGTFATGNRLNRPVGMAIGPDGALYVSNATNNDVLRYDLGTGAYLGVFATGSGLAFPYGLQFGPDNNLYVASTGSDAVLKFNGGNGAYNSDFADLFHPAGLVFGPDHNLYVGTNYMIEKFNGTTGASMGTFVNGLPGGTTSLTFGPDGNLYACADNANEVFRYNGITGASMGVFASGGGLSTPEGLTFGPDGNLYVTSFDTNSILRYNGVTGAFMGTFASGGGMSRATYALFVPEPSSLTGLLLPSMWIFKRRTGRVCNLGNRGVKLGTSVGNSIGWIRRIYY